MKEKFIYRSVFLSEYIALLLKNNPKDTFEDWKRYFREAKDNGDFSTCYQLLQEVKHLSLPTMILAEVRFQEGLLNEVLDHWQAAEKCFSDSLKLLDANDEQILISNVITHLGDSLKKQGRWTEALRCYNQALEIDRKLNDLDAEVVDLQDIASILEE